jgi:2-amino-4-hydroxy-6-hydroxymethyldihydropteridine diphosphokinase
LQGNTKCFIAVFVIYRIGVGTSHPQGERLIQLARQRLSEHALVQVLAISSFYPNPAFGGVTLLPFVNAAFKIQTPLHPDALWFVLHSIEMQLGRVRLFKNGPRTLDLDVLDIQAGAFQSAYLRLPHPQFKKRPFALKPASDIGPP